MRIACITLKVLRLMSQQIGQFVGDIMSYLISEFEQASNRPISFLGSNRHHKEGMVEVHIYMPNTFFQWCLHMSRRVQVSAYRRSRRLLPETTRRWSRLPSVEGDGAEETSESGVIDGNDSGVAVLRCTPSVDRRGLGGTPGLAAACWTFKGVGQEL